MILGSTVIALLCGEILARFIVNPGDFLLATLSNDPVLGHRIKPRTTGHDGLGFRNPDVPEHAGIVAIGDSMTYGFGVTRLDNWPNQLGALLRDPVYNMSLGGYGPLHYLHLATNEATKLRPRLLLVGLYLGNDIIESYNTAHQNPYWRNWAEAGSGEGSKSAYQKSMEADPRGYFAPWQDWLAKHSVIYSMLRATVLPRLSWEKNRVGFQTTPDDRMAWIDPSGKSVRTVFTPQLRLSAMEPRLPSVQEGLRITKRSFAALKSAGHAQGAKLLVVMIPTKEGAYCGYLNNSGAHMPASLARLCEAERQIKEDLLRHFDTSAILHVDVTGALEEQISAHVQIYPQDSDAHPGPAGYRTIARTVYDAIVRLKI